LPNGRHQARPGKTANDILVAPAAIGIDQVIDAIKRWGRGLAFGVYSRKEIFVDKIAQ